MLETVEWDSCCQDMSFVSLVGVNYLDNDMEYRR